MTWLLVALGTGVGAALRFTLAHLLDGRWPTGTLTVNVAGSFLLGVLSAEALSGDTMALLGTGLCGGLTTFSALLVQTAERGSRVGTAYVLTTVAGSLLVCWLGFMLAA
ncbi:MAG: CrcB family protein [Marmoricola sp.]